MDTDIDRMERPVAMRDRDGDIWRNDAGDGAIYVRDRDGHARRYKPITDTDELGNGPVVPLTANDLAVIDRDHARIREAAVSRVRLARDRALDLAEAILHATAPNVEFMNPVTPEQRQEWRSEIDRLKRMAEKSDAYFDAPA